MYNLFSTDTWNSKHSAFVEKSVESLVKQFPLLEYFNTYLTNHLGHDLGTFDGAIKNPDTKTNLVKLSD